MPAHRNTFRFGSILVWLFLVVFGSVAFAQDATPIQMEQNIIGELTIDASSAAYAFTTNGDETADIQVLALSPDFAPRFRVVNPAGVEIFVASNADSQSLLLGSVSFADAGVYTIEVSGENGALGQFVLSLQPGEALPEAVELIANQPVSDTVGGAAPIRVYHFSTTLTDSAVLTILSEKPDWGVLTSLYDETLGRTIATHDAGIHDVVYRLSPGEGSYRVEVRASGEPSDTAYSICFGTCEGSLLASQTQEVTVLETPEVAAVNCTVASATGGTINVRSGPGTQYTIIGNLAAAQTYPALGQLAGGGWFQVSLPNGQSGWIASSVTRLEGDCAGLAIVAAPGNAALAPTQQPTQPPAATQPSSSGSSPTATATLTPSATPTEVQLADLVITTIYNPQVDLFTGALRFDFRLDNNGLGAAENFPVTACFDNYCTTWNIDRLAGGSSRTFNAFYITTNPPVGLYYAVSATADRDNVVPESNESNNTASGFIT